VLNQFPRNSRHISRLPYKNVPILLEEFDEREFLFGVQTVAYVSHLRRFLCGQQNCFAECVHQLDGHLGSLGIENDRVRGDSAKACFRSWSYADASNLLVVSLLFLSQSKARLMCPLRKMTPRGPGIFKTR
jgi:hypothetical protein